MSDWELYNPEEHGQKNTAPLKNNSDWERYTPKESENYLYSLIAAPARLGEDLIRSGYGFAQKIPGYMESARTEVPGLYETLKQQPGHAGMQAFAGANEAINKLAQLPKNIAQYGEERLNLVPHGITQALRNFGPEDTTGAIEQLFGSPEHPGEELLRGTFRNIPELAGLGKAGSFANSLRSNVIAKDVLSTKEAMKQKYSGDKGLYNKLFQKAEAEGARPDLNIDINKIKFNALGESRIKNNYEAIDKLRSNQPLSLTEYQNAIKEFGIIERELKATKEKKGVLTDKQDNRYHEAIKAKKYLESNMFKDSQGKLIKKYLPQYKDVQKGYAKEVIPYTTNKAISKFERGDIKQKELIAALRKSPFASQRGGYHNIETRDKLLKSLIGAGLLGAGSVGVEHGIPLIEDLLRAKSG
jgi:hypothetical protein